MSHRREGETSEQYRIRRLSEMSGGRSDRTPQARRMAKIRASKAGLTDYLAEARKKFPIKEGFTPSDQSRYVKMKEEAATLAAGKAFSDPASAGSRAVRRRMQEAGLNVPTEEMAVTAAEKSYAERLRKAVAYTEQKAADWEVYVQSVKSKQVVKPTTTQEGQWKPPPDSLPTVQEGLGVQTAIQMGFGQLGVQPSVSPFDQVQAGEQPQVTQDGLGVQPSDFQGFDQSLPPQVGLGVKTSLSPSQLIVGQLGIMGKEEAQVLFDVKSEAEKKIAEIDTRLASLSAQTYATPAIPANVRGDRRDLEEQYLFRVPFATAMSTEEQKANLKFDKQLLQQESTARLKFLRLNPDATAEQKSAFEQSISSWKSQEKATFKQSVSSWKSSEQKRLESELKEWRLGWRPSGVAVQTLAASMQKVEGMPPVLEAVHGAVQTIAQVGSGVIATGESFIYGIGGLIGIKTPAPPPTLSGGLISSGIQSIITGGLTESYEMQLLKDMPLTYTAGTILGDIGLSLGLGYGVSKVAGKIVPKSVMAKYQQYVSKPLSRAVTKVTKKVTAPVTKWWRGSPVDLYLMGKSKRYATHVAKQMSTEVAILGNLDDVSLNIGAKWQKAKEFSQAALVGDIDVFETTKAVSRAVQYSQAEDYMWDVLTMTKSGVKMGRTAFITVAPYKKGELIARSTDIVYKHLVSQAGVTTGIGYLSGSTLPKVSGADFLSPVAMEQRIKDFLSMSAKSRGLVQTAALLQIPSAAPTLLRQSLVAIAQTSPLTIGTGAGVLFATKMFPQTAPDSLSLEPSSPILQVTKPQIPQQPLLKPDVLTDQFTQQETFEPQVPYIPVVFQPLKSDEDQAVVPYIPTIFDVPQKPDIKQKPAYIPKVIPIVPQEQDTPQIPDVIPKQPPKTVPDDPQKPYIPPILIMTPTIPFFPRGRLPRVYPRGGGRRTKVPSWWEKQEYLYPIRTEKSVASLIFADLGGKKKKNGKKVKSPVSSIIFAKTKKTKKPKTLAEHLTGKKKGKTLAEHITQKKKKGKTLSEQIFGNGKKKVKKRKSTKVKKKATKKKKGR